MTYNVFSGMLNLTQSVCFNMNVYAPHLNSYSIDWVQFSGMLNNHSNNGVHVVRLISQTGKRV